MSLRSSCRRPAGVYGARAISRQLLSGLGTKGPGGRVFDANVDQSFRFQTGYVRLSSEIIPT